MINGTHDPRPFSDEEYGRFGERLKQVIGDESVRSFSRRSGVSDGSLRKCLEGGGVTLDSLLKISAASGVAVQWLATGEGPMRPEEFTRPDRMSEDFIRAYAGDKEAAKRYETNSKAILKEVGANLANARAWLDRVLEWRVLLPEDYDAVLHLVFVLLQKGVDPDDDLPVHEIIEGLHARAQEKKRLEDQKAIGDDGGEHEMVPIYDVEVAAGAGALPALMPTSRNMAFRRDWLASRGLQPATLALVTARGNSMEPTIADKDVLMVDRKQTDLSDGAIYVIRSDGHLVVKRIQRLLNRGLVLISDNTSYRPLEVTHNEASDLQVIGRVIWIGKEI